MSLFNPIYVRSSCIYIYSIRHNDREQKMGVYSYTLATQMLDITKTVIVVPFYHETDRALHSLDCEQAVILFIFLGSETLT